MTSENAEQPPTRSWGNRQTLIAVIVAIVIGALGGAAIYAATQGTTHAMGGGFHGQMHAPPPGGPSGPGGPPRPPDQSAAPGVLHSEYVMADGNGGFSTKITQTGTVDEVTPSSIVVRSDDGFTQIYQFPSANVVPSQSVVPNDTVTVQATRTGAVMTLNSIDKGPPQGK